MTCARNPDREFCFQGAISSSNEAGKRRRGVAPRHQAQATSSPDRISGSLPHSMAIVARRGQALAQARAASRSLTRRDPRQGNTAPADSPRAGGRF